MYQPYPSSGQAPEPARRTPPPSVVMAVRLMYAGAAVSALSLIVSLFSLGSIHSVLHRAYPTFSESRLHAAEVATVGVAVFFGLIGIGLWVWMALANKAGKSWARILASVFFGLNTLLLLLGLARPTTLGSKLVSGIIWLIGLGAVIFLWRPDATEYYNATRGN